ncbi:MAG: hypothetical protein HYT19_00560 [Candidatus Nealsonbacteria bacterium]|nr:hypothetical protein [Candidatus Nealsonbacteria bacterium]
MRGARLYEVSNKVRPAVKIPSIQFRAHESGLAVGQESSFLEGIEGGRNFFPLP